MALDTSTDADPTPAPESGAESSPPGPRRRRALKVLAITGAALVVVVATAALVFFLGREQAEQLSDDQALVDFRSGAASSSDAAGVPAAGVYAATASGTESIGLPGFDEVLGPNAPVTVTHDPQNCFTYRADFNSHHWRSWTFCPTDSATFSLTTLESWTARKAPGLDIATLSTYTCEQPLDLLWTDAAVGDTRTSACTGTSDMDDSITADVGLAEVLGPDTLTVDGEEVDVVRVRTTDTFSEAQTGSEVGEWWLHVETGMPLRIRMEAELEGGPSSYSETFDLELSTLAPAT